MKKLTEYLDTLNNDTYKDMKFVSVSYFKRTKVLKLVVNYKPNIVFENISETLTKDIKNYLGLEDIVIEYKARRAVLDQDVITNNINTYLQTKFSSLYFSFDKNNLKIDIINDNVVNISIGFATVFFDYLKDKNFEQNMAKLLEQMYFAQFYVKTYKIVSADQELEGSLRNQVEIVEQAIDSYASSQVIHKIDVTNVEKFIGEHIEEVPTMIKDVKIDMGKVAVAGTVSFMTERSFKSKKVDENGNAIQRVYYNFTLKDGSGAMHCVFFPSQKTLALIQNLQDGMQVVVDGDLDNYNDRISIKVKNICTCVMPEKIEIPEKVVKEKKVLDRYLHVFPEPYIEKVQVDMFSSTEQYVCDFIKNNKFVVFDLETSGLDTEHDEITEIGAVRVENGRLSETFTTLISINRKLTPENIKITGITDDMLKDQLPIDKVLPDFYKFVDGYILVGYNSIGFDSKFILREGRAHGYKFTNEQIDAWHVAQQAIKGLKNYKLDTVNKALGIVNKTAHRALSDAIATAEAFIKLENMLNAPQDN